MWVCVSPIDTNVVKLKLFRLVSVSVSYHTYIPADTLYIIIGAIGGFILVVILCVIVIICVLCSNRRRRKQRSGEPLVNTAVTTALR